MTKVRRLVWIDSNLLTLLADQGVELSTFLSKSLTLFLDLPEDPHEKLLRENLDKTSIRVRIQYLNELRTRIQNMDQAQTEADNEKAKQIKLISELTKFGERLLQTSCYYRVLEALKTLDAEAPCWDTTLREINSMNGDKYTFTELWNKAIEWYRLCPAAKA